MATSSGTRSKTSIWLIGEPLQQLSGAKLPSKGEMLRRFYYIHYKEKKTIHQSATEVVREILEFWSKARIPTSKECNIIKNVENIQQEWRALHKNRSRQLSSTQRDKERNFETGLNYLFDVAHADALQIMNIEEDRSFLKAQRLEGRPGSMVGVDKKLFDQEERNRNRKFNDAFRRQRSDTAMTALTDTVELTASSSNCTDDSASESPASTATPKRKKVLKKNIVTPEVAASLDRTRTSNRAAVHILNPVVASLGQESTGFSINRETIRRTRMKHREKMAEELKKSFSPLVSLTVHWDGKLLPDLTGSKNVDRLPIVVSGEGITKLLGVPKLLNGTGEAMAQAVVQCLNEWDVCDRIQALSFDTTASNTGRMAGACTLIQQKLGRNLLHLACRHHIMEIMLEKVFSHCLGVSSGPDIPIFKRFQQNWDFITKEHFQTMETEIDKATKEEIVSFCSNQLQNRQPRDDYRELLELSIISLGETPPRGFHFMRPGALHRARWMAKVIYSLKIRLFRQQLQLTTAESTGITRICRFAVTIYIRAWIEAPVGSAAPANDLALLKNLTNYSDEPIGKIAFIAFSRHLWYLSEELVGLALFDPKTTVEEKRKFVKAMKHENGTVDTLKRITIDVSEISAKTVASFATKNSMKLLTALQIDNSFLRSDPTEWKMLPTYLEAQKRVSALRIVNDLAERGVSLIQSYNQSLTKNETQFQFLLQVVEDHRQRFSQK